MPTARPSAPRSRPTARLRPAPLLAGLAAAALLAGCDLGPDYRRPALEVPAQFRATPATAAQAWPSLDWWRGFRSSELDGLIAEAQAHNNDLAAAVAQVRAADAQVKEAGSSLLPTLTAGADSSIQQERGTGRNSATVRAFSLTPLNVSYELDFWGRNRALYQAARATAVASRFDQQTVALTVVSTVATTYFTALAFADQLAIARRNLADTQQSLDVIRGQLAAGIATALDLAQEEAQYAGIRAQIPSLESQLKQETIALGILVGRPPETIVLTADTLTRMAAPEVQPGLPSELLARRPDVAYAEANLVAQNADVKAARAAFFPTISLTGAAGWSSTALTGLFGPAGFAASLAGSATQTIFDNGGLSGALALSHAQYDVLLADYRKAVLQAFTDVETALTAYRYATDQEQLEQQAVAAAQRAADIARAQLAAGTVDVTTLLTAQTTLYSDQNTLAQVRLTRFTALVSLYQALGGGWVQDLPIPGAA